MKIPEIKKHKFIILIEYALKNESFSVAQACKAVGISEGEFHNAKYSIFQLRGEHEYVRSPDQVLSWELSAEAFFDYLSYLQYRDAVKFAKRAHVTAIVAIIISGLLALGSIIINAMIFLRT